MTSVLEQDHLPDCGSRVSELDGEVLRGDAPHSEVPILPMYHPAATFYNPDLELTMEGDFGVLEQFP